MGYRVDEIYKSNSDLLKAEDIGTNFWTRTIVNVEMKDFDNGDRKLVLHMDGMDKVLPLNQTNARTISDLYGGDTDAWIGRQVMLFTMPVDFNGKKVQAIRLRAPAPQGQQPAYTQTSTGGPSQLSHQRPLEPAYDGPNAPPPNSPDDYGHQGS